MYFYTSYFSINSMQFMHLSTFCKFFANQTVVDLVNLKYRVSKKQYERRHSQNNLILCLQSGRLLHRDLCGHIEDAQLAPLP